jgi:putative acetyltransferase
MSTERTTLPISPLDAAERAGVRIRSITAEDAADLAETMSQPRAVAGTLQLPYTPMHAREAMIARSLDDPDTHFLCAVTIDGDRAIGNIGVHTNSKRARKRHVAAIGMSVHDDWQGTGVGTALMAAALDLCDRWLQVRRIELEVHVDNPAALRLYEKFGFQVEGTLRDYSYKDGAYCDAHVMSRIRPVVAESGG